jgi:tetratricopeptide (TPR) repeat protein
MRPIPMKQFFFLLLCGLLTACLSDDKKDYNGAVNYQMGLQAEQAGDLPGAQQFYAKAQKDAKGGHLGPAKEAHATFALARINGYLGKYAEAEKGFNETFALIGAAEGEANALLVPALFEYALMLHDTGQHAKAVPIYRRAFEGLEKMGVSQIAPLAYASFLDDYSESLKAAGFASLAAETEKKAALVREKNPGGLKYSVRRYK